MRKFPFVVMFLLGPALVLASTLWMASLLQWSKVDHSASLMVLLLGAELAYMCALGYAVKTDKVRRWIGFSS